MRKGRLIDTKRDTMDRWWLDTDYVLGELIDK